ncbi:MAG TPA: Mur ligase family protein [Thermoanaerobaculia bacterium]|nr:Mur ligase family protein [Thermoanaerobaculia bacterium]
MKILDSRRLTGRGLLLDRPGALLDVAFDREEETAAVALWQEAARGLLDALGLGGATLAVRRFPGGASLAFSAPIDILYTATEINEAALEAARAALAGEPVPPLEEEVARLSGLLRAEANPRLLALEAAAGARGVAFLWDGESVSVGLGTGSLTFPLVDLPAPEEVDWPRVHDVPVALVTGTNGKTTTVRLAAAMAGAAGRTVGSTSTDRIQVGDEVIDRGDYSGPGGARTLLRDRRVEIAILETARGGLLRRGLALERVAAALVTNIAADHLGEYGIQDLPGLAEAKLVVARAVSPGGRVILNADDPALAAAPRLFPAPITWFTLDPETARGALKTGAEAAFLDGDQLVFARGDARTTVATVADVPIAHGGAARYNLANALGAIVLANALGLPVEAMAEGLARFGTGPEDNLGRANLVAIGGFRILLDYAHNPHGLAALAELARTFPAQRRLLLLGQAGDRDDEAIRELARTAWSLQPDHIVLKEMPAMLRGRAPGEISALLEAELRRLGAPPESLEKAGSEIEGVERALAWARPGDLLILPVHTDRDAVLARLGAQPEASPQR